MLYQKNVDESLDHFFLVNLSRGLSVFAVRISELYTQRFKGLPLKPCRLSALFWCSTLPADDQISQVKVYKVVPNAISVICLASCCDNTAYRPIVFGRPKMLHRCKEREAQNLQLSAWALSSNRKGPKMIQNLHRFVHFSAVLWITDVTLFTQIVHISYKNNALLIIIIRFFVSSRSNLRLSTSVFNAQNALLHPSTQTSYTLYYNDGTGNHPRWHTDFAPCQCPNDMSWDVLMEVMAMLPALLLTKTCKMTSY